MHTALFKNDAMQKYSMYKSKNVHALFLFLSLLHAVILCALLKKIICADELQTEKSLRCYLRSVALNEQAS